MTADRIAILPATYEDDELRRTFAEFDTVILMKVHRGFDRVFGILQELGLENRGVFVRRVGSDRQEVVTDLASLVGTPLDYLSLLIVSKSSVAR